MDNTDSSNTMFLSGPAGLARILAQDQPEASLWSPDEMRAMWQHQMRAPLEADLSTVDSPGAEALRSAAEAADFRDKTFNQLLSHPAPPLPLLKLIKEFAKQTLKQNEDPQLKEIAAALYYSSYAVALLRCGKLLGGMSRHELQGGLEWALGRVWLDGPSKEIIEQARSRLADGR